MIYHTAYGLNLYKESMFYEQFDELFLLYHQLLSDHLMWSEVWTDALFFLSMHHSITAVFIKHHTALIPSMRQS